MLTRHSKPQNKVKSLAPRTDYGPPPKGYVPGAGRGAVGFTTRSDIGPARQAVVAADRSLTAQRERARQVLIASQTATVEPNKDFSNFDHFSGYSHSLFATGQYDDEDNEADTIYKAIDKRMDSKRKLRRENLEKKTWMQYHKKRPRPSEFFATEKKQLQGLSANAWNEIPEAVDFATRKRQKVDHREKFTPLPVSLLNQSRRAANVSNSGTSGTITAYPGLNAGHGGLTTVMPLGSGTRTSLFGNVSGTRTALYGQLASGTSTAYGSMTSVGTMTSYGTNTALNTGLITDMMQMGKTRDIKLQRQLDRASDSVTGQTVVDPKGYFTDLCSFNDSQFSDASDIAAKRDLLRKFIEVNKTVPRGWVAAAKLEEGLQKTNRARKLMIQATEHCPDSQEVWLEAARLHGRREARHILAQAVKKIPRAPKIWIKAAMLEKDIDKKRTILRRGLEYIPDSVQLWEEAIELEDEQDAKILLVRAVEQVPKSVKLWLALAGLESYSNARKVLNKARKKVPTDPTIWIAAAKLEEREGEVSNIRVIVKKAVESLQASGVKKDRDSWLEEAWLCEQDNCPITCQAIVWETIGIDVERDDRLEMWKNDAQTWLHKKAIHTTKAIYGHILTSYEKKWTIWWDAATLEINHGTPQGVFTVLADATKNCPTAVKLWLLWARELRDFGDMAQARRILQRAFAINSTNEDLWLAAHKLELGARNFDEARNLLIQARTVCRSRKIWLKSAVLERSQSNVEGEREILEQALQEYKAFDKLWMMKAQFVAKHEGPAEARRVCQEAVHYVPDSVYIWLEYARLEVKAGHRARARAILENARTKIPREERLWLAACQLETNPKARQAVLSKALIECKNSGQLWAFAIECEPLTQQKSKCLQALEHLQEDVHIMTATAKFFWRKAKKKKAKTWFERAVLVDSMVGDTWAWYYVWTKEYRPRVVDELVERVDEAQPKYGAHWIRAKKRVGNEYASTAELLEEVASCLPGLHENSFSFGSIPEPPERKILGAERPTEETAV